MANSLGFGIGTIDLNPTPYEAYSVDQEGISQQWRLPKIYGTAKVVPRTAFRAQLVPVEGQPPTAHAVVHVLGEGECDSLLDILFDGVSYTDPSISDYVTLQGFYTGTDTQNADTWLSGWSAWGTDSYLRGVCYAVLTIKTVNSPFSETGFPNIEYIIKGKKVFDNRTSSTIYSENPAVCFLDYLKSDFGAQLSAGQIDQNSFDAAANYFDTSVSTPEGSEAFYSINGVVDTSKKLSENLKLFTSNFNMFLSWRQGKFYLEPDQDLSSTYDFVDQDILGEISIKGKSKDTRFNQVSVIYNNEEKNYTADVVERVDATYLSEDNGTILRQEIKLPLISKKYTADRIAKFVLDQSRFNIEVSFKANIDAYKVKVGDVVTYTNDDRSWVSKKFKVKSMNLNTDFTIDFTLVEHDSASYALPAQSAIGTGTSDLYGNTAINPPSGLTVIQNEVFNEITDKYIQINVLFSWTAPTTGFTVGYTVQYKKSVDTSWNDYGVVAENSVLLPVTGGTSYDFRVRTKSTYGYSGYTTLSNVLISEVDAIAAGAIPNVTGLQIVNNSNPGQSDGNNFEFYGRDLQLKWNAVGSKEIDWDTDNTGKDWWHAGYLIEFHDLYGNLLRSEVVVDESYVYSYEHMKEDGAPREFEVSVWTWTIYGQKSAVPSIIYAKNPPPPLPTNLQCIGGWARITIQFDKPSDLDYEHMLVYVSRSSGFTPSDSNKARITDATSTDSEYAYFIDSLADGTRLEANTTYYVVVAPYDSFGTDELNYSSEFRVSTQKSTETKKAWYNTIDLTDAQFISDVLASDSIESTKIANLTAAKITSGYINATEQIKVAGTGGYDLTMGLHSLVGVDNVISFSNGSIHPFRITANGDAIFSGQLSTGSIVGDLVMNGGAIRYGKTSYASTVNGFWLKDTQFNIGSSANYFKYTGSSLELYGNMSINGILTTTGLTVNGTLTGATIQTASSGKRFIVSSSTNEAYFYGDAGGGVEKIVDIGINTSGGYDYVSKFGTTAATRVGVYAQSSRLALLAENNSSVYYTMSAKNSNTAGWCGEFIGGNSSGGGGLTASGYTGISGVGTQNGVYGYSANNYSIYAGLGGSTKAALIIQPSSSSATPSHSAAKGSLWVTSTGDLYLNKSGSTTWTHVA